MIDDDILPITEPHGNKWRVALYLDRFAIFRSWMTHYCKNVIICKCICELNAIPIKTFPVIFYGNWYIFWNLYENERAKKSEGNFKKDRWKPIPLVATLGQHRSARSETLAEPRAVKRAALPCSPCIISLLSVSFAPDPVCTNSRHSLQIAGVLCMFPCLTVQRLKVESRLKTSVCSLMLQKCLPRLYPQVTFPCHRPFSWGHCSAGSAPTVASSDSDIPVQPITQYGHTLATASWLGWLEVPHPISFPP